VTGGVPAGGRHYLRTDPGHPEKSRSFVRSVRRRVRGGPRAAASGAHPDPELETFRILRP